MPNRSINSKTDQPGAPTAGTVVFFYPQCPYCVPLGPAQYNIVDEINKNRPNHPALKPSCVRQSPILPVGWI